MLIILVTRQDAQDAHMSLDVMDQWHYGPNTVNPWPQGDYWDRADRGYTELAWSRFPSSRPIPEDLEDYEEVELDYCMDVGL